MINQSPNPSELHNTTNALHISNIEQIEDQQIILFLPTYGNGLLNRIIAKAIDKTSTLTGSNSTYERTIEKPPTGFTVTESGGLCLTPIKGYNSNFHLSTTMIQKDNCVCFNELKLSDMSMPVTIPIINMTSNDTILDIHDHDSSKKPEYALSSLYNQIISSSEKDTYSNTDLLLTGICVEMIKVAMEEYQQYIKSNDPNMLRVGYSTIEQTEFGIDDPSINISMDNPKKIPHEYFTKPGLFIIKGGDDKRVYRTDLDINNIYVVGNTEPFQLENYTIHKFISDTETDNFGEYKSVSRKVSTKDAASQLGIHKNLMRLILDKTKYEPDNVFDSDSFNITDLLVNRNQSGVPTEMTKSVNIVTQRPPLFGAGEILKSESGYYFPLDLGYIFPFIQGSVSIEYFNIDQSGEIGIAKGFSEGSIFRFDKTRMNKINNSYLIQNNTLMTSTLYNGWLTDILSYDSGSYVYIVDNINNMNVPNTYGLLKKSFVTNRVTTNSTTISAPQIASYVGLNGETASKTLSEWLIYINEKVSENKVYIVYEAEINGRLTENAERIESISLSYPAEDEGPLGIIEMTRESNTYEIDSTFVIYIEEEEILLNQYSVSSIIDQSVLFDSNDGKFNLIEEGDYLSNSLQCKRVFAKCGSEMIPSMVVLEDVDYELYPKKDNYARLVYTIEDGVNGDYYKIPSLEYLTELRYNESNTLDDYFIEEGYTRLKDALIQYTKLINSISIEHISTSNYTSGECNTLYKSFNDIALSSLNITQMSSHTRKDYFLRGTTNLNNPIFTEKELSLSLKDIFNSIKDKTDIQFIDDYYKLSKFFYSKREPVSMVRNGGQEVSVQLGSAKLIDMPKPVMSKDNYDSNINYIVADVDNDGNVLNILNAFLSGTKNIDTISNLTLELANRSESIKKGIEDILNLMYIENTPSYINSNKIEINEGNFANYEFSVFSTEDELIVLSSFLDFTNYFGSGSYDGSDITVIFPSNYIVKCKVSSEDSKYYISSVTQVSNNVDIDTILPNGMFNRLQSKMQLVNAGNYVNFDAEKNTLSDILVTLLSLISNFRPYESPEFVTLYTKENNMYYKKLYDRKIVRQGLFYYNFRKTLFIGISALDWYRTIITKLYLIICSMDTSSSIQEIEEKENDSKPISIYGFMNGSKPLYPLMKNTTIELSGLNNIKLNQIRQVFTAGSMYYKLNWDIKSKIESKELNVVPFIGLGKPQLLNIPEDTSNLESEIIDPIMKTDCTKYKNINYNFVPNYPEFRLLEESLRNKFAGDYFFKSEGGTLKYVRKTDTGYEIDSNKYSPSTVLDVYKSKKILSDIINPVKITGEIDFTQWFPYLSSLRKSYDIEFKEDIEYQTAKPDNIEKYITGDPELPVSLEKLITSKIFVKPDEVTKVINRVSENIYNMVVEILKQYPDADIKLPIVSNADVRLYGTPYSGESALSIFTLAKMSQLANSVSDKININDISNKILSAEWYNHTNSSGINHNMDLSRRRAYYTSIMIATKLKDLDSGKSIFKFKESTKPIFYGIGFGSLFTYLNKEAASGQYEKVRSSYIACKASLDINDSISSINMDIRHPSGHQVDKGTIPLKSGYNCILHDTPYIPKYINEKLDMYYGLFDGKTDNVDTVNKCMKYFANLYKSVAIINDDTLPTYLKDLEEFKSILTQLSKDEIQKDLREQIQNFISSNIDKFAYQVGILSKIGI